MQFQGAKTPSGMGGGIILISPLNKESLFAFQFQFEGIDIIAEYETLLHGLEIARSFDLRSLKVIGGSDQIVS